MDVARIIARDVLAHARDTQRIGEQLARRREVAERRARGQSQPLERRDQRMDDEARGLVNRFLAGEYPKRITATQP